LPALALPGAQTSKAIQAEEVAGLADLFLLPNRDDAGAKMPPAVAARLAALGWQGRLWTIPLPDGLKDVSDWRVRDPELFPEELAAALHNRERVEAPAVPSKTADKPERKAAATRLVELVEDAGIELYHTDDQAAFADVRVDGRRETVAVRGAAFKLWLSRLFFTVEGRAAGSQALHDALSVIESTARFDGPERAVHVRLAETDGKFYLDLGDRQWRVVEIDAAGWRIVEAPAVRFRRPRGMLPMPEPQPGGSVEELRQFVNVSDDGHWRLLVAWLLAALRPCGPYPLLVLSGQQGPAKSTTARLLRALIDPNKSALRSEPKETRDLMIAATNSWCLCFDNLSSLTPWLSDALCRLATGGGFATRELYTDAEESLFDAQRPVLLNGIEDLATRGDLLDRAIPLNLPPIPEGQRRAERSLWRDYELARPRILGALLTAVAGGLRELPNVRLTGLPRMADFAEWAVACEKALNWPAGSFLDAYGENRKDANEVALESSPLVPFLRQFVEANVEWTGTASALLAELRELAGDAAKSRDWPGNARGLSGRLKRLAPNLRAVGIVVEWEREEGRKRTRVLRLSCQQDKSRDFASVASVASEEAETPGNNEADADANGRKPDCADAKPHANGHAKAARQDAKDATDAKSRTFSYLAPGLTPEDAMTPFDAENAV
jgi:hypothetical protein